MTSAIGAAGSAEAAPAAPRVPEGPLAVAQGAELLGPVHGSGYADGVSLVRRADGQMVQLGPLLYGVLEAADGARSEREIAEAVGTSLGRKLDVRQVQRIAEKLAAQGLLAGSEAAAPPRRNPLLALRWKVLVTNPRVTRWLTAPFTILFRPWVMWPVVAAFVAVCWFILFDKGLAEPGAEAFRRPGLLLLIFAIGVASAGFHELGHAAACRYSGATPGGMGVGVYLVWPAFYTDVTDAYRLDRRSRLRVDLGGLYFNAVIAVAITAIWFATKVDALLLGVALQLLLMVRQLSPVIRADGYHILADATGVPDLFAHIGPTLKRLIPGTKRSPSALTGKARALVTIWVLVVVPVLLSLMAAAILLLPRLATSAWNSGHAIVEAIPDAADRTDALAIGADLLRLVALALPVLGSVLIGQRLIRVAVAKGRMWSAGHPARRVIAVLAGAGVIAGMTWAWWPNGQYQPVRSNDRGTLPSLVSMLGAPSSVARPAAASPLLKPGRYLALAMVPERRATNQRPVLLVVPDADGKPVAMLSTAAPTRLTEPDSTTETASPPPATTPATPPATGDTTTAPVAPAPGSTSASLAPQVPAQRTGDTAAPAPANAFRFTLPAPPGPGDTQALATNRTDGAVVYRVAYAVVTVSGSAPVTDDNTAFALASCHACTTVAVSFQIVLVVGESHAVAPINAAEAINMDCPVCVTMAMADQLVVTLTAMPPEELQARLAAALQELDLIPLLGPDATPEEIAARVLAVQREVEAILNDSGLLAIPLPTATASPTDLSGATPTPSVQPTASGAGTTTDTSASPSASSTPTASDTDTAATDQSTAPNSPSPAQSSTSSP